MREGGERADHGQLAHIAGAVVAFESPDGHEQRSRHSEWRSMRASSAAWRCISCLARLMRVGMTRVAAYSSKLLRNVPRWRLSKASTAPSSVRPANALSSTDRETPAAAASRDMADRKALKSPPHGAALAGVATSRVQNRMPSNRNSMPFPNVGPGDHRRGIAVQTGERQGLMARLVHA